MSGPVEADPEYQLIVESNNMLLDVETEISMCLLRTNVSLPFRFMSMLAICKDNILAVLELCILLLKVCTVVTCWSNAYVQWSTVGGFKADCDHLRYVRWSIPVCLHSVNDCF